MHRTGRSVLVAALALVASACAGSDAPGTSARGTTTSPPPAASPDVVDFEGARSLPPGRYRSYEGFAPRFEFRLDLRWEADHALAEFFDFHREGLTVAFASPERVASRDGLDPVDDMTAAAFLRSMLSHPGIDGERAGSVPVDGNEVPLYDVRADDRVGMFGGPEGEFSAVGSDRYRLGALRVGDAMLVLMSFTEDESRDAFQPAERAWATISLLDD